MRIALDAMGTDLAPEPEVLGALRALEQLDPDIEIVLVGDESVVREELAKHGEAPKRLTVHNAPDRVTASDAPASVIRRKPASSIVVGLKLHQEGTVDAFVSAGSTGAIMATSLFTLRPLPGVARPAVGTPLPTVSGPCLLIDSGANVDCKPHHLVQFAHLGSVYARDTMGLEKPRVALLNIGEESSKGNDLAQQTFKLLQENRVVRQIKSRVARKVLDAFRKHVPPPKTQPMDEIVELSAREEEVLEKLAKGFLLKDTDTTELVNAIRAVHKGESILSPAVTRLVIEDYLRWGDIRPKETSNGLTPRENEILQLIAEGNTNKQIAEILCISIKTVQAHRGNLMNKLDLHDKSELIKYAIQKKIIEI